MSVEAAATAAYVSCAGREKKPTNFKLETNKTITSNNHSNKFIYSTTTTIIDQGLPTSNAPPTNRRFLSAYSTGNIPLMVFISSRLASVGAPRVSTPLLVVIGKKHRLLHYSLPKHIITHISTHILTQIATHIITHRLRHGT
jgi:hypothetical protein